MIIMVLVIIWCRFSFGIISFSVSFQCHRNFTLIVEWSSAQVMMLTVGDQCGVVLIHLHLLAKGYSPTPTFLNSIAFFPSFFLFFLSF